MATYGYIIKNNFMPLQQKWKILNLLTGCASSKEHDLTNEHVHVFL